MAAFAFLFPGQGSQSVGMLDAWGDHRAVRETLAHMETHLARPLRMDRVAEAVGVSRRARKS